MTLTPAQNGFLKGIILAVLSAVTAYLADPAHLTIVSGGAALIISALASSFESYLKDKTGNGLFGAVRVS